MSDFLDDSITDILLRLPVKSLLRFRCVSKTWCALIDNNSFVKQHLNHSVEINTKHKLILENNSNFYTLGLCSLTDKPLKLVHPFNNNRYPATFLGSCNGLLCIMYSDIIIIWNPATRKHVKVPSYQSSLVAGNSLSNNCIFVHGFGYDTVSDDYKVVVLIEDRSFLIEDRSFSTETRVYSLRSNSWRIIEDFPDFLIGSRELPGALACGALHWSAAKRESKSGRLTWLIAAFDLVTEKHMIVALPNFTEYKIRSYRVSELGGFLSFVCDNVKSDVFDVWVMKDYGVTESWTKLLTLSSSLTFRIVGCVIPLAYSQSGCEVLLLLNSEKLVWYNLENKTFKFVDVRGLPKFFYAGMWLESLVSLGKKAEYDKKKVGEKEGAKRERKEKVINIALPIELLKSYPVICIILLAFLLVCPRQKNQILSGIYSC